uniref:Golgi-associated plant pathogenesis-related protein 1 n=1 Tax=Sander lucioperca TaxID=283035 RepID=A0A8D0CXX2_SANLU
IDSSKGRKREGASNREKERRSKKNKSGERLLSFSAKSVSDLTEGFLCQHHGEVSYAESLASTRILKHSVESSKGSCGENLAWASYDQSGKDVTDRWYDEVKQYNFNRPGFSSGTGHFTAMVWKSSNKLGVGKATASDGSSFVVARYFPAGNITNQGHFENNVLPAKSTT